MKKIFYSLAAAATIAAGALVSVPAQAAVQDVPVEQAAHCTDGSNVRYDATIKWNYSYVDAAGTRRASVSDAVFGTAEDTNDHAIDNRRRVYSYHVADKLLHKIQDVIRRDGEDENSATGFDDVHWNPKNPTDHAGHSEVTLVLGTDNDGRGDCKIVFVQPALGTRPVG
jgi:hypothetical protein